MWKLKVGEGGKWLSSVNNFVGRQEWEFDEDAGTVEERAEVENIRLRFKSNRFRYKQSSNQLLCMQMRKENEVGKQKILKAVKIEDGEEIKEEALTITLRRGIDFISSIQAHDGHWPSECAGPLYFTPMFVMGLYITGGLNTVFSCESQKEIKRYIYNQQNKDGGWGFHSDGSSIMFCTTLNYVSLRLLGEDVDNADLCKARKWILDHGGAVNIPSWGKLWLSILGVYEWDGCNPFPPEPWLLPVFSPIHPGKMMLYCRLVYLPVSYIYGKRFVGKITPLIQQLRQELYLLPYHQINWNLSRNACAKEDLLYKCPKIQELTWAFLYHIGEPILKFWPFLKIRERALEVVMKQTLYGDNNSQFLNEGCVEKALDLVACWIEDPNAEAYKRHIARVPDYIWVAEDGMKVQGLGSQTWDASFMSRTIMLSGLSEDYGETLRKAHAFLKASQIRNNPSGDFKQMFREPVIGGWPFSEQDCGYQATDCTAEALQTVLMLSEMDAEVVGEKMETSRLCDAVDLLLRLQSENGGFPSWERRRMYRWMETFNPTEMFKDLVVEREYVEVTSSVIQALTLFKKLHPEYLTQQINNCIKMGIEYIVGEQNPDGSWYGRWGVCYTYGACFAVEALILQGLNYNNSVALRKCCEFLLTHQLPDGGWGESVYSCTNKVYTNLEGDVSNLVQTSWALLALMKAGQGGVDAAPIQRGIKLLINSQIEENGDFPQQEITGVFMGTCLENFGVYRIVFPLLALGEYRRCILCI